MSRSRPSAFFTPVVLVVAIAASGAAPPKADAVARAKATRQLRSALTAEDIDGIRAAIADGADVRAIDDSIGTPFIVYAASLKDADKRVAAVTAMLDAGVRADTIGRNGTAPLHAAVKENDLKLATLLIARGAKTEIESHVEAPPILQALRQGPRATELVKLLLEHHASARTAERDADKNGFVVAAGANSLAALALLAPKTDLAAVGPAALERATAWAQHDAMRWLLDKGVKPELPKTPHVAMQHASRCQPERLAQVRRSLDVLAAGGVDLSSTPLAIAVSCKSEELYRFLVSKGADPREDAEALVAAARAGHLDWTRRLLDAGAPIAAPGALHAALEQGHLDTAALLVERGASLVAANAMGRSPVGIAVASSSPEQLTWLLARLTDANRRAVLDAREGRSSRTALHIAIHENRPDAARALLAAGADPRLHDGGNRTARELAIAEGQMSLVALLDADAHAKGATSAATKAGPAVALIYGGGVKHEDAAAALLRWQPDGELLKAVFSPLSGFPKIVRSDDVKGLKPGFYVVLLGVCDADEGARGLEILGALDAGTYARPVETSERSCPARHPSVSRDGSWVARQKAARLTVSEIHTRGTTRLIVVGRGADGSLIGGHWLDGRGRFEGPWSADCELSVTAQPTRIVVERTCTNIFSNMCRWPDRTVTTSLTIEGGKVLSADRSEPENAQPTVCGE